MATPGINAIGRLWEDRPDWFGIAPVSAVGLSGGSERPSYVLVFGASSGETRVATADDGRGVLLALVAYFEADAAAPPPELEMTHREAAEAVRALAVSAENVGLGASLRDALDAIDDGLPADVVTASLYRALEATPGGGLPPGGASIEELRQTYERLGR